VRAAFAPVPVASGEPLRLECEQFTNAVRTRTPPYSDGEEGLAVVAVLAAAQRSLEGRGVPVEVEYE
jgi:predicted dehydrogenase